MPTRRIQLQKQRIELPKPVLNYKKINEFLILISG